MSHDMQLVIRPRAFLLLVPFFLVLMTVVGQAAASPPPPVTDACSALRIVDFTEVGDGEAPTKVLKGERIEAYAMTDGELWQTARRGRVMGVPVVEGESADMPAHCKVTGYVNPHIQFELRLPEPHNWNGRFLLTACDGFCGKTPSDAPKAGVMRGYATMSTDGGHVSEHPFDGVWAKDNLQARIDFGYRANHVLLMASKAILREYYGEEQAYSYLTGCSKGGHAGVMSASRFPHDYDGIVSRDPTINYSKVNILRCADTAKAVYDDVGNVLLDASKTILIQKAVMAQCDGKDGLVDGMISDPRKCDFEPKQIQCGQPEAGFDCLTEIETKALEDLYSPVTDSSGNYLYAGQVHGSEMAWPAWALPLPGDQEPIYALRAARDYLKFLAFKEAPPVGYDWKSFLWERDHQSLEELMPVFDADDPDLSEFAASGNKMMVLHGWADPAVPPQATIEWYDAVSEFFGGRDNVMDFSRLFLLPGNHHCDGGVGPDTYEALELITAWVERGEAPDQMMTTKYFEGELERARPVYPFPIEAKYDGTGDVNDAANFRPHDPRG
ncbi:MAG: tannase/feruloyl esterase family alpha/beta hydrolase [Pseudomonadota bacterium]